jgi:prepilin-type N-terminal cleavage/methylation domain-containing protein/prepilin-type processing-associated H-X9-DG protein
MHRYYHGRRAFTLVELLVVIGIIALLIGILLPALNKARESARTVKCMSNIRQWGIGMLLYADANKGQLPDEGDDGDAANTLAAIEYFDSQQIWFNAVPKYVNGKSYFELQEAASLGGPALPRAGDGSIFTCPSANAVGPASSDTLGMTNGYFNTSGYLSTTPTGGPVNRPTLFAYAPNSELNNGTTATWTGFPPDGSQRPRMPKMGQLKKASNIVLMIEKRLSPGEVDAQTNAFYDDVSRRSGTNRLITRSLSRTRGDWQRFAGRHKIAGQRGGGLLFADGHVEMRTMRDVVTPALSASAGNAYGLPYNGAFPDGNWNSGTIIWNLSGVATR